MNCSADIQPIVAEIIRTGILRIRAAAWAGDAEKCATEADHIHNLPSLLKDFRPELLHFYWETERPDFIESCNGESLDEFRPLWDELGKHSRRTESTAAAD